MQYKLFIGVDVSKETLDFVVLVKGEKLFHIRVGNDESGINRFYKKLTKEIEINRDQWIICMEHTGIYCNPLLGFATKKDIAVWLESAAKIYRACIRELCGGEACSS